MSAIALVLLKMLMEQCFEWAKMPLTMLYEVNPVLPVVAVLLYPGISIMLRIHDWIKRTPNT